MTRRVRRERRQLRRDDPEGLFCVAAVLHEAFVAVDEKGTEAAAATAVVMRETAAPRSSRRRWSGPAVPLRHPRRGAPDPALRGQGHGPHRLTRPVGSWLLASGVPVHEAHHLRRGPRGVPRLRQGVPRPRGRPAPRGVRRRRKRSRASSGSRPASRASSGSRSPRSTAAPRPATTASTRCSPRSWPRSTWRCRRASASTPTSSRRTSCT